MTRDAHARRRAADPGALLATTYPLASGERVRLRLTRPSDRPRIDDFLRGIRQELEPELVRTLTYYDPTKRIVVAATRPSDGREQIVGLAAVGLQSGRLAELGAAVAPGLRRQGLGLLLLDVIASLAAHRGATHLKAVLPREDARLGRLLERIGPTVRGYEEGRPVAFARIAAAPSRAA